MIIKEIQINNSFNINDHKNKQKISQVLLFNNIKKNQVKRIELLYPIRKKVISHCTNWKLIIF